MTDETHAHDQTHRHERPLTKNQALVMGVLDAADGPLSAYTILDALRESGFRAPLQVYRALDKLVAFGMVHRLESLNAFVPCRHDDGAAHKSAAFTICESCGKVTEIADAALTARLEALSAESGFSLRRTTVELRGLCEDCRKAA
ncbi:Fur family transcriptional regulator [Jiella sp. M17.18]|uniref:Fur family transcriptional regulator n=1 Tax=Jiella sp. M17.18 TaxID=3234247 RepID=UPI0034E005D1